MQDASAAFGNFLIECWGFLTTIVQHQEGCNAYCFGPRGPYWTMFGAEIDQIHGLISIAIVVGAAFFLVVWQLRRRQMLNIHPTILFALPVLVFLFVVYVAVRYFHAGLVIY